MRADAAHTGYVGKMIITQKPRAYVDMDDVIADYMKAKIASKMSYSDFNAAVDSFRNLEVMKDSRKGLALLEDLGYEVWICTRPPGKVPHAWADKAYWILEHFPFLAGRVIMTPDKGCIGQEGDLLIDDSPASNNGINFRGTLITHASWEQTMKTLQEMHPIE